MGTGAFIKTGEGQLTLAGDNTYHGATIINGGTLRYTGASQLETAISLNSGVLDIDGASARLSADDRWHVRHAGYASEWGSTDELALTRRMLR